MNLWPKPTGSLETRITAAGFLPLAIATLASVGLFALLLLVQLRAFEDELRLRARSIAESLSRQSELALLLDDRESLEKIVESVRDLDGVLYCGIRGRTGEWLAASGVRHGRETDVVDVTAEVFSTGAGQVMDWDRGPAAPVGAVRVVLSAAKQAALYRRSLWSLGVAGALALFIILQLQLRQIRKILQPLQSLIEFTRKVAGGDLSQRAAVAQRDEVGRLAEACNEMVSKLESSRADLLRALEAANEASRLKSEFLANMSHEIRTPLNGVIGTTELALESQIPAEAREHLAVGLHSAQSLLRTLNDILDLSKIEAGKLDLNYTVFDVEEEVTTTAKAFAPQAQQKGVEIVCDFSPDVPARIRGDAHRLGQVLSNLLSNAVKFTAAGEIVLSVESDENGGGARIAFAVRDTGIGIAPEKLRAIFDPFTQADGSMSRTYGGTGLGLAICARLAAIMGGTIDVDSRPGEGSTFRFTAVFETAPAPGKPARFEGRRALVIDPHESSRRALDRTLVAAGLETRLTGSPDEGRAALAREGKFDFALVDTRFADDWQNARPSAAPAPVSIWMAAGGAGAGADLFVTKPVAPFELRGAMERALRASSAAARPPDPPPPIDRALTILVAEDNAVNEKVLCAWLLRAGHHVQVVRDGAEAVAAALESPFDVILMDVQMPGMDGLAATRAIREKEAGAGRRTPIVAVTAHALTGDREMCIDVGMDGYLTKPIRAAELFAVLRSATAAGSQGPSASKSIA